MKPLIFAFLSAFAPGLSVAASQAGPERLDVQSAHEKVAHLVYPDGHRTGLVPVIDSGDAPPRYQARPDRSVLPWRIVITRIARENYWCYHPLFQHSRANLGSEAFRHYSAEELRAPCFILEAPASDKVFFTPPPADDAYVVRIARKSGWLKFPSQKNGGQYLELVPDERNATTGVEVTENTESEQAVLAPFIGKMINADSVQYVKIVSPEQYERLSASATAAAAARAQNEEKVRKAITVPKNLSFE